MSKFVPAPDVRFAITEDGGMLLNLATGKFFGLNPSAAAVWRHLADGVPPEEVAVELADSLFVTEERLLSDVHRLADTLGRHGLLLAKGAPS